MEFAYASHCPGQDTNAQACGGDDNATRAVEVPEEIPFCRIAQRFTFLPRSPLHPSPICKLVPLREKTRHRLSRQQAGQCLHGTCILQRICVTCLISFIARGGFRMVYMDRTRVCVYTHM